MRCSSPRGTNFGERRQCEVRRMLLPRTRMNAAERLPEQCCDECGAAGEGAHARAPTSQACLLHQVAVLALLDGRLHPLLIQLVVVVTVEHPLAPFLPASGTFRH